MNFVLSNEKVQELINKKIINPFVPKGEDGITPIYVLDKKNLPLLGEGGLGSGTPLKLTKEQKDERRREQLKNAQRKYRNSKRELYNERQLKYYKAMKEDPARYSNWKNHMIEANERYRAKKSLGKPPKALVKDIESKLRKEWKEKNKGKRGRPKKGEEKKVQKEVDKEWFEAEKQKRIQEEMKKIGKEYSIPMKNTGKVGEAGQPIYEKFDFALKTQLEYPYTGDKDKGGEMPYTEQDYLVYNATNLVPNNVKREKKKLVGEEYVDVEEKKEMKAKAKAEKPKKEKKAEKIMTQDEMEYELVKQFTEEVEPTSQAVLTSKSVRDLIMGTTKFKNWLNKQ